MDKAQVEIWRPIPKVEKWFEISNLGRVRDCVTHRIHKQNAHHKTGYYALVLWHRDQKKYLNFLVHTTMWRAFNGPVPPGMHVCHNDDVREHNYLSNLRIDTPKGNNADRVRLGNSTKGTKNPNAKLTEAQVHEIRSAYDSGEQVVKIAARFGLHVQHAGDVARRQVWAWLPEKTT
jgi:hypothetical protein